MGKGAGKGADGEGLLRRRIVERGGLGEAPAEAQSTEDFGTADAAKSGWPFAAALTTRLTMTIDGEQYDMTDYKHPGGDIIWDADQHDATSLFYSTHPMKVWKKLSSPDFIKKYAFKNEERVKEQARDDSGRYSFTDEFYVDCKKVVEHHLLERQRKYGKHMDGVIVFFWTISWYVIAAASYWYCMASGGTTLSSITLGTLWSMAIFNL